MDKQGVMVILDNIKKNPHCPHGPTILFERTLSGVKRRFYACAACRDRKDCVFFHWEDEPITEKKIEVWKLEKERILPKIYHRKLYVRLTKILQEPASRRAFCHTCTTLILPDELPEHISHDVKIGINDQQLASPSKLLKPLENPKKEAQYLFSERTTEIIVDSLRKLGARNILCIGTPRIHEHILSRHEASMSSLLMDIDWRYHYFHGPLQFCWYNAFNHHFFNGKASQRVFQDFLQQKKLAVIMDPPFGGRAEPLAHSLQRIIKIHKKLNPSVGDNIPVFWIFPYFMEPRVLASCPAFRMLDYKVDYDNHLLFQTGPKGRKYGSPVRIFTNVSPDRICFPASEGYKFCKVCRRWVSSENKHCFKCKECTSKDGRTYVHCNLCARCVKPSWEHCATCERCCLPAHVCGEFQPALGCFNCAQLGHKKRDCTARTKKRIANVEATTADDDGLVRVHRKKCKKRKRENGSCQERVQVQSVQVEMDSRTKTKKPKISHTALSPVK